LREYIKNVFCLLICEVKQIPSNVALLFLYLSNQGLSQTLAHDVDKTLGVLRADVARNDLLPIGESIDPGLDRVEVRKLGLQISLKVLLSEVMNVSAVLNF
jgi:hypothetical protein